MSDVHSMKQTQMENVKSQVRGGDDEINLMYTKYIYIQYIQKFKEFRFVIKVFSETCTC